MNQSSYDPYVSKEGTADAPPSKIVEIQKQIDETVIVMRDNIKSTIQRGEGIDALQDKSARLSLLSKGFHHEANKVQKKMWWKDVRMKIIIAVVILILLSLVIILPIVLDTNTD